MGTSRGSKGRAEAGTWVPEGTCFSPLRPHCLPLSESERCEKRKGSPLTGAGGGETQAQGHSREGRAGAWQPVLPTPSAVFSFWLEVQLAVTRATRSVSPVRLLFLFCKVG